MLYANSSNGEKITAQKYAIAFCPTCNSEVVAKCGDIVTHHWAHKANNDCDTWHEPETEWHLNWKKQFHPDSVEVTLSKNGLVHRADVCINNLVVEFQHSPISAQEITDRESFYGNMIWVFDLSDANHRFENWGKYRKTNFLDTRFIYSALSVKNQNVFEFYWKNMRKTLFSVKKHLILDFGEKYSMVRVIEFSFDGKPYGLGQYIKRKSFCSSVISFAHSAK